MAICLLSLGANQGDRPAALHQAGDLLQQVPGTQVLARSSWQKTAPVGGPAGQDDFLNGAILLQTALAPEVLLEHTQQIETTLKRVRTSKWGPRTLDVDLLLYDRLTARSRTLTLPHPRMSYRRFVLDPAVEIAGQAVHPDSGWTVFALRRHLLCESPSVGIVAANRFSAAQLADQIRTKLAGNTTAPAKLRIDVLDHEELEGDITSRPTLCIAVVAGDVYVASPAAKATDQAREHFRRWLEAPYPGPRAKIAASQPEELLSEAFAALRSVWPALEIPE